MDFSPLVFWKVCLCSEVSPTPFRDVSTIDFGDQNDPLSTEIRKGNYQAAESNGNLWK